MSNVDLVEIEQEIDALMSEVQAEFTKGWPIEESVRRLLVRVSPDTLRVLAVRGLAATASHKFKLTVCEECGGFIEE